MDEKMVWMPQIYETNGNREYVFDIYSRLLKDRLVFVDGEINDTSANLIVGQILFLESQDPEKDISIYINSPGGSVTAGLAIYDTIQYARPDVQTICIGQASSMGASSSPAERRASALPSPRPGSSSTSPGAASRDRPRTSASRPRRSSGSRS